MKEALHGDHQVEQPGHQAIETEGEGGNLSVGLMHIAEISHGVGFHGLRNRKVSIEEAAVPRG